MSRAMEGLTAADAGLVSCTACLRLHPAGTPRCDRCGAPLRSRAPRSLSRVWAWWWAGLLAYIPANTYPMLITRQLFREEEATILGGAIELANSGDLAVAGIVFFASIMIPVAKCVVIAYLAVSIRRVSVLNLHRRHKLYEVVEFIGRWSMIDVFVVAILVALVQFEGLVSINPGIAAASFAVSVAFTMLSAQSFDPRSVWDAEKRTRR